jgi:hypothetical protein
MQELRGPALRLLATAAALSPRHAGGRAKAWPGVRIALEGLGLSAHAAAGCKQFLLQARPRMHATAPDTHHMHVHQARPIGCRRHQCTPSGGPCGALLAVSERFPELSWRGGVPVQVPGEAEAALHRLQAKLDAPSGARRPSSAVFAALEDVGTVTAHLRAWGLPGAQA